MKNNTVKSRIRGVAARSSFYQRAFVIGAGTAFDLGGTSLKAPDFGSLKRDSQTLKNDFSVISKDFENLLNAQLNGLS